MTVIAYHLIWTNYGTWLANDPRGSGSSEIFTPALAELGKAHFGRKKVQPSRSAVREFYAEAEGRLQFPVIRFEAQQRNEMGDAFADVIRKHRYTCYACAIMPEHVHLVIRKHKDSAEAMIDKFQDESREWFIERGVVPRGHPVWTKNGWRVFLDSPAEVWARIRYVEGNPFKDGLAAQRWPFVVPYDNWPFHKKGRS